MKRKPAKTLPFIGFRLSMPELKQKLEARAKRSRRSVSAEVQDIVETALVLESK